MAVFPERPGTKKQAGHGGKRYRHDIRENLHQALQGACYNNMRYLRRTHRKDDAPRARLGTGNAEGHIQHQLVCDECRRKGTAVKDVPVLKHGGIQATKSSPVITTVTLNARDRHFWAARLLLMAAGFKAVKGTAQKYEIHAAFAGVNRWLKAHAEAFPISKVGYTDIATGREFEANRNRNALDSWLTETQEIHGSDPVTGIISKPTK